MKLINKTKDIVIEKVELSENDHAILKAFEPVAEGIATIFGSNCEVVIHSLEDIRQSVIKIVNGHVTGRQVGAPLTDLALDILKKANNVDNDVIGCYYSKLDDGTPLKSVTMIIRNSRRKIIGMMCVNMDLSVSLIKFLRGFFPNNGESLPGTDEHYPSNLDELVAKSLDAAMARQGNLKKISATRKNKLVVTELYNKGLFKITGVIDIVAKNLGISRYTVYNYIREVKTDEKE
jgi:predicted transcriptional regulator YheO